VFTARYALSPYTKQIRFVFKGLKRYTYVHIYIYRGFNLIRNCKSQKRLSSLHSIPYVLKVQFFPFTNTALPDMIYPQRWSWRHIFGFLRWIAVLLIPDVSETHAAFIFPANRCNNQESRILVLFCYSLCLHARYATILNIISSTLKERTFWENTEWTKLAFCVQQ
jgi:hypothetical protein